MTKFLKFDENFKLLDLIFDKIPKIISSFSGTQIHIYTGSHIIIYSFKNRKKNTENHCADFFYLSMEKYNCSIIFKICRILTTLNVQK